MWKVLMLSAKSTFLSHRCLRSKLSVFWSKSCLIMDSGNFSNKTLKICTASSISWSASCRWGLTRGGWTDPSLQFSSGCFSWGNGVCNLWVRVESEDHPRCSSRGLGSSVALLAGTGKADVPDSWTGSAVALVSAQPLPGPTEANSRSCWASTPGQAFGILRFLAGLVDAGPALMVTLPSFLL